MLRSCNKKRLVKLIWNYLECPKERNASRVLFNFLFFNVRILKCR